jgi:hypothetical protein
MHPMHSDPPTLRGTRLSLSAAVAARWRYIEGLITEHDYSKPGKRLVSPPGLGEHPSGSRHRPGAFPLRKPPRQCVDRPEDYFGLSWHSFTSDVISVGRAIRFPCDQEAGWQLDDDYDFDRPVDLPRMSGG